MRGSLVLKCQDQNLYIVGGGRTELHLSMLRV